MFKLNSKSLVSLVLSVGLLGSSVCVGAEPQKVTNAPTANMQDVRLETQLSTTYQLNRFLKPYDIDVKVNNGEASLTGKVDEEANKALAEQIALGIEGIKKVANNIVVDEKYRVSSNNQKRRFSDVIEDSTITASVKSKLLWSKYAEGLATEVDTNFGTVTLKGSAESDVAKEIAGRIAMNTHGVSSIKNDLKVEPNKPGMVDKTKQKMGEAGGEISDSWITTKVKSTLLYSSNVNSADINVSTDKGMVTLSGKLGSGAERELAIKLAEGVRGVKEVKAK